MLQADQVKKYTRASFAVSKKNQLTLLRVSRAAPVAVPPDPAAPPAAEAGAAEVQGVVVRAVAGDPSASSGATGP